MMIARSRIQTLIDGGLYAAVFAIPFSFFVNVFKSNAFLAKTKIPLFDCVLWVVFIVWLWDALRRRGFARIKLPPLPISAFAVIAVVSAFLAGNIFGSTKELIQVLDCFVIFPILFMNNIVGRERIEKVILCLGIVSAAVVVYGLVQFALLPGKSYLVRSVFDNRNVLAGFLAMTIPLFFAFGGVRYRRSLWVVRSVVMAGGTVIMTAFFPFFVLLGTVAVMSNVKYRRKWPAAVAVVLFALVAVSPVSIPIGEIRHPQGQFIESRDLSGYHEQVWKSAEMTYSGTIVEVGISPYLIHVSTSMAIPREIPKDRTEYLFNAHRKDAAFGNGAHVAQRFIEWRAALNVLGDRPVLGVGMGRYQQEIGRYYSYLPKLNTMEPDAQNGYCITLVTTGLIGLACLVWILQYFFARIRRRMIASNGDACARDLSLGLFGSLIGFAFANLFVPILYQSTAAVFILILSIAASMNNAIPAPDDRASRNHGGDGGSR
jgi:hypothetical protein